MGKKQKTMALLLGGLCLTLCVGGYSFLNWAFPKASPPPDFGSIIDYEISYRHRVDSLTWETITLDAETEVSSTMPTMLDTLALFGVAKPTRLQSGNDTPTTSTYFQIDLDCTGFPMMSVRFFVYALGDTVYFEIPYGGIYEADPRVLTYLEQDLEEWLARSSSTDEV